MASVGNCPACKKEASKSALTCPHCGHQLRRSLGNQVRVGFAIGAGILLIAFMYGLATDPELTDPNAKSPEREIVEEHNARMENERIAAEQIARIEAEKFAEQLRKESEHRARDKQQLEESLAASKLVTTQRTIEFLRSRTESGSASAAYKLGVRYLNGDGVDADRAEAMRLLNLSADRGDKKAKAKLLEIE